MEESDLAAFFSYRSDPSVARYQGWTPWSLGETADFIAEQRCGTLETPGRWFQVAIALRTSGKIVGDIGLCLIGTDEVEIGFTLAPEAQRLGYATEAVRATIRTLFRSTELHNVRAVTDVENSRSIALLERLGFVHRRTYAEIFQGQWCQHHRYMLSRNSRTTSKSI